MTDTPTPPHDPFWDAPAAGAEQPPERTQDLGTYGGADAGPPTQPQGYPADYGTPYAAPYATSGYDEARPARWKRAVPGVVLVAAGAIVGAILVTSLTGHSTGASNTANAQPFNGGQGQLPNGQLPNGQGGQGGQGGNGFGGFNGEQRLVGTVTTVTASSFSLRVGSAAPVTYQVSDRTQIVKNGAEVALSAIKVGDTALVHVYPLNGQQFVERLIVGNTDNFGGPPAGGPPGTGSGSGTGDGTTTHI